jgi:hypothetical protein
MATKRVSTHWNLNQSEKDITKFNLDTLTKDNLVNQLLVLKKDDISYSVIMELFGEFNGKSLCKPYDTFDVPIGAFKFTDLKGKEKSNKNKFTTTIGLWIFNIAFLRDFGFSDLFGGYISETIGVGGFEDINQTLTYALLEDKITVEQYRDFLNEAEFFMPFETILSPNYTEPMLTSSKKIAIKKKELYKLYKDKLDQGDPVTAEKMEQELLAYAKELLKDDPCLDPLSSGAAGNFNNNFKNMFIMKGAVLNPDPAAEKQFDIALSSWIDGIAPEEYSFVANSLTKGAYSRGKKTELGGYWEKLCTRATNTIMIDPPGSDCGTTKYIEVEITKKNIPTFIYNYIIKSNGQLEELTSENINNYIGKKVKMRYAGLCKSKTGICHHCAGNFFYRRGSNKIGLAVAQIPDRLKLISMKSFHDSTVTTAKIDASKAFGFN